VSELVVSRPRLKVVVLVAEAVASIVTERVKSWPASVHLASDETERLDAMAVATAALACSGTVTTELALAGAPMVVAYRLDPPTAVIARLLIRTPYITLFNVAAGRAVAPELLQEACTGPRLAAALAPLFDDPSARRRQAEAQTAALEIMRGGVDDPAGAAAEAVLAALPA
jgi:lipid-A-disaccharide synthase